ncbi:MAG: hypothetical protein WCG87_01080 [Bacteroidota bacterium]
MNILGNLKDKVVDFVDVRVRLLKLSVVERTASILSYFAFLMIILLIALLAFVFIGFGMAEWFTALLDSRSGGFFLAAFVFILLLVITFALRAKLFHRFANIFVQLLTEDDEESDTTD